MDGIPRRKLFVKLWMEIVLGEKYLIKWWTDIILGGKLDGAVEGNFQCKNCLVGGENYLKLLKCTFG